MTNPLFFKKCNLPISSKKEVLALPTYIKPIFFIYTGALFPVISATELTVAKTILEFEF